MYNPSYRSFPHPPEYRKRLPDGKDPDNRYGIISIPWESSLLHSIRIEPRCQGVRLFLPVFLPVHSYQGIFYFPFSMDHHCTHSGGDVPASSHRSPYTADCPHLWSVPRYSRYPAGSLLLNCLHKHNTSYYFHKPDSPGRSDRCT